MVATLAGCLPKQTYRVYERLTLHFQTPDGPTTAFGVGVKTYRYYSERLPLTNTELTSSFGGEAIVIDFGPERTTFALIPRGIGHVVAYGAFDAEYDKDPAATLEALAQTCFQYAVFQSDFGRSWLCLKIRWILSVCDAQSEMIFFQRKTVRMR